MEYDTPQEFFKNKGYVPMSGILDSGMCSFLTDYLGVLKQTGKMVRDRQCPNSLSVYGDPVFDTLLLRLTKPFSAIAGEKLAPTYSYTRIYAKGEELTRHRDRGSCEISATITIGIPEGDPVCPIFMARPEDEDGESVVLSVGDGCLYRGCDLDHWRPPFISEWYMQTFLHYVRVDGEYYPEGFMDGRDKWGVDKL